MICSHCGKEVAKGAIKCANCGRPLSEKQAKSNTRQVTPKDRYRSGFIPLIGSLLPLLVIIFLSVVYFNSRAVDTPGNGMATNTYLGCSTPFLLISVVLFFIGFRTFKCVAGLHPWSEWSYNTRYRGPTANFCEMERTCSFCQRHETRQPQPHSWSEWTYISAGSCDQLRACVLCQAKESRQAYHDWEDWKYKSDSCEQVQECRHCHQTKAKTAVHDWEDWKYKPNSCEQERECKRCHQSETKAGFHDWGEWNYEPNSCKQERECGRCQQREAKAAVHDWGDWNYKPDSCMQGRECKRCHLGESQAGVHDWGEWNYKPNSCEQERECRRCHRGEAKAAVHDWGEWSLAKDNVHETRQCKRCSTIENRLSPLQQKIATQIATLKAGQPIWYSQDDPKTLAHRALLQIGKPSVLPLLAAAKECTGFPLELILKCLGELGDTRAFDLFMASMQSPDADIRAEAALGLGQLGKANAVQSLIEALKDPKEDVRENAAEALGNLKDRQAVGPLMAYAQSNVERSLSAVEALGKLKDEQAVGLLIEIAANDRKQDIRKAAKEALAGFGPDILAQLNEKLNEKAVKISPAGRNLFDRMHDQNKTYDAENPITLDNGAAILYYETRTYEEFRNSWVLEIPGGAGKHDHRRIKIDPEQSPDQTVADILQNAPGWCISIDAMDRLYILMICGVAFNWENSIQIQNYASIFQDQKKEWHLRVHVSPQEDRDFKLDVIDENIGQKVKDIIAATGISLMLRR